MKKVLRYIAVAFWVLYILIGFVGIASGNVLLGIIMIIPPVLSIVLIWPPRKSHDGSVSVPMRPTGEPKKHPKEKAPIPAPAQKPKEPSSSFVPDNRVMSYVVLDVETTGLHPASDRIIEIALLKVENGAEAGRYETFLDPKRPLSDKIAKLTGITKADLQGARSENEVMPEVASFIGDLPIVGHNVGFDLNFLASAYVHAGLPAPRHLYFDTLALAEAAYPGMPNYKLDTLIHELGLAGHAQTHRAMDDVLCTNRLFCQCQGLLQDMLPQTYEPSEQIERGTRFDMVSPKDITATVTTFDKTHPLYGKRIVFTGTMRTARQDAMQMAVDVGAIVTSGVSSKTDYLVVGRQDKALVGDDGLSSKEEKAYELNQAGKASIKILSESQFLGLLQAAR